MPIAQLLGLVDVVVVVVVTSEQLTPLFVSEVYPLWQVHVYVVVGDSKPVHVE